MLCPLKLSTIKPFFNLGLPSTSGINKSVVAFSSKLSADISSRLPIRVSRRPISFIVYRLLLSFLAITSSVLITNGLYVTSNNVIALSISSGGIGFSDATPLITWN